MGALTFGKVRLLPFAQGYMKALRYLKLAKITTSESTKNIRKIIMKKTKI